MLFFATIFLLNVFLGGAVHASGGTDARRHQRHARLVNTTSGVFAFQFPHHFPGIASLPDIPYAQNPTGSLRFARPVPASPPADGSVGYASELPRGCFQYLAPQFHDTIASAGTEPGMLQRGDYSNTTEDCLRLSIFAPRSVADKAIPKADRTQHNPTKANNKGLLPVIVWIHGGGYLLGGTNVPYQLAPNWVQRSQRHIVVQVQYRLNILGHPNAGGLKAQNGTENANLNLSFLDQRLAVEWVRDNIASMGGDPHLITLWGESAGAFATDGYLFAWADDPIVSGVIADSGNAISLEPISTSGANNTQFSAIAAKFNCAGSPAAELSCMRAVPASELKAYMQAPPGGGGATDDALAFPTVTDNVTVFANYADRIVAGSRRFPSNIPLLIGTNKDEGGAVVPYSFNGSETAQSVPAALAPIAENFKFGLQCTTIREVRLRAAAGAKTWQYLYAGNFSDVSPRPWLGAFHTAELPMVFGTFGTEGQATSFEKCVSESMQDLYLAFAENPHAGLARAGWPPATGGTQSRLMEWAAGDRVRQLVELDGLR